MTIDPSFWNQQALDALAYFTSPRHAESFQIWEGHGSVLVSAPHAVEQWRDGKRKCAERYTGVLARLIHQQAHCHSMAKTRNMHDDANHDPQSDYRDALKALVQRHQIKYVIDLHQLSPKRNMALCIGTGWGKHLKHDTHIVPLVTQAFEKRHLCPVTIDQPFSADRPYTVAGDVARNADVVALQLEINTKYLLEQTKDERMQDVLDALLEVIDKLDSSIGRSDRGGHDICAD